jgi:hypothetical protein
VSTLALEKLYDDVVAGFTAAFSPNPAPPQPFGWRAPAQRSGAPVRVCWVPGDDESGDLGEVGPARFPGRNARPLATLRELFTVYVEAQDASQPENERKQYHSAREFFDLWWAFVYRAAPGNVAIQSAKYITTQKERRFGCTIRVLCTVDAMIPDASDATMPVDAIAQITTAINTGELTIAAAPVRVATTTHAITLSGANFDIDGVTVVAGDRVLVKSQGSFLGPLLGDDPTNGIYVVANGTWTRAADADASVDWPPGRLVYVGYGDTNRGSEWELTTPGPIVLDTTALRFERTTS